MIYNVYTEYGVVTEDSFYFNKGDIVHQITKMEDRNDYWSVAKVGRPEKAPISKSKLVRIPNHFWAYVKRDTLCHKQKGKVVEMSFDGCDGDEMWTIGNHRNIPIDDIVLSTISLTDPVVTTKSTPNTAPMPTMADLNGYDISVRGRTVTVFNGTGIEASATCHPHDEPEFDFGLKLAYNRAKEAEKKIEEENGIKAGDKVKVIDTGKNYSTFKKKIIELISDPMLLCKYAYGDFLCNSPDKDGIFIVRYIDEEYAYIEHESNGRCRLMEVDGIAKYHKEQEDLEEEDDDWMF